MIRHLLHADIDKTWWDGQLEMCANRSWYAQSWVLDTACPGWEALVDDDTKAIMPLTRRRKFGYDYLYQPYGLQQLGVFAQNDPSRVLSEAFIAAIPERFKLVDIYLNERMGNPGFKELTPNTNQSLVLDRSMTELRNAYSKGHHRNLKKPVPPGTEWSDRITAEEMTRLFVTTTARRHGGIRQQDRVVLGALIAGALERGEAEIAGFKQQGRAIAANCLLRKYGRVILFKSGCTDRGMAFSAMFHLADRIITERAGSGLTLDLAGSNAASVARFNDGFGAVRTIYFRLRRNNLPYWLRILKR